MSQQNLSPERLQRLYPSMPEAARTRLRATMRALARDNVQTSPPRRSARKLIIAIAIVLLLGGAVAEVATGVVSTAIRQVFKLEQRPKDEGMILVKPSQQRKGPVAVVEFPGAIVHISDVRADGRALYVDTFSRVKPGSDLTFMPPDDIPVRRSPSEDVFPDGERWIQPKTPSGSERLVAVSSSIRALRPEELAPGPETGDSPSAPGTWSSQGVGPAGSPPAPTAPPYSFPLQGTGLGSIKFNSDGSRLTSMRNYHDSFSEQIAVEVEISFHEVDIDAESGVISFDAVPGSELTQKLKMLVPVAAELEPPVTIAVQRLLSGTNTLVDRITLHRTELMTYCNVWFQPSQLPADDSENRRPLFYLEDAAGNLLPHEHGMANSSQMDGDLEVASFNLRPGPLPRVVYLRSRISASNLIDFSDTDPIRIDLGAYPGLH